MRSTSTWTRRPLRWALTRPGASATGSASSAERTSWPTTCRRFVQPLLLVDDSLLVLYTKFGSDHHGTIEGRCLSWNFKHSKGARNQRRIGLSYRPASLQAGGINSLESIPGLHNNYLCTCDLYTPVHNDLEAWIYITWGSWRGLGPGIPEFFGPCEMASSW